MAELFGIDIAKTIGDALGDAGGLQDGTLIKGDDRHAFQGFKATREVLLGETRVAQSVQVVTIIGNSLAGVEPAVNDRAEIDGGTYDLVRLISRDPAAAVYEFEAQ